LNVDPQSSGMRNQMDQLAILARTLLPAMLDSASGLFPQKAVWTSNGLHPMGANVLYSAMSAIGIQADSRDEASRMVDLGSTLNALYERARRGSSSLSALAATTWALAVARDDRTNLLLQTIQRRFRASKSSSMELGLVLSALAAFIEGFPGSRSEPATIAVAAQHELVNRFSDSSQLFRGSSAALRPRRAAHLKMTSFASQVYPIHGLAHFARAAETPPPTQILRAADRLVEMQGPLGQWWWIYSSSTGAVVEGYPVYAVHQDAMAFMALAPLQNLGLRSYARELAGGLQWIFGGNELGTSLPDFERVFISRCIQRRGGDADGQFGMSRSQLRRALLGSWGFGSSAALEASPHELEILQECRPYHLGWILYARSLIEDW
jgi:hypothetical protein